VRRCLLCSTHSLCRRCGAQSFSLNVVTVSGNLPPWWLADLHPELNTMDPFTHRLMVYPPPGVPFAMVSEPNLIALLVVDTGFNKNSITLPYTYRVNFSNFSFTDKRLTQADNQSVSYDLVCNPGGLAPSCFTVVDPDTNKTTLVEILLEKVTSMHAYGTISRNPSRLLGLVFSKQDVQTLMQRVRDLEQEVKDLKQEVKDLKQQLRNQNLTQIYPSLTSTSSLSSASSVTRPHFHLPQHHPQQHQVPTFPTFANDADARQLSLYGVLGSPVTTMTTTTTTTTTTRQQQRQQLRQTERR